MDAARHEKSERKTEYRYKRRCGGKDGRGVQEGEQVVLGGNGQYVSLCRKHFRRGELGDFKDLHLGEE